jgi:uncharacterized membrane protein YdjX (TVP38/TMEM64 family)
MVWLKRGVAVAAVAGLAALLWVVWDHEAVMAWIGQAGPLPFFAAMGLLPVLGAPLAPFFIVAGATFGVAVGLVGSVLALLLNLAACYRLARSRFRPHLEKLLRRFDFEIPDFDEPGKSAFRFTLLVKLAPGIPVFIKNYGLGAAGVPFGIYLGIGMLISGAYGLLLVVLGESLMEHDVDGILAVAAVVVVLAVGLWWWRRRQERDPTAAPATSLLGGALALLVGSTASAAEPSCPENEPATRCAAKQEENPIAGIVKVQLENNTSYLIGPNERTLNVLNLQPIIPLALGKKLTLVALSRIPLVWSPNGAMPTGTTFGMGDITTNLFVSASARRIVRWGIGPALH